MTIAPLEEAAGVGGLFGRSGLMQPTLCVEQ